MSEFGDMIYDATDSIVEDDAPVEEQTTETDSSPVEETTTEDDSNTQGSEQSAESDDEEKPDQKIPYERFQETNERRKEAEARAERFERELAEIKAQLPKPKKELPPGVDEEQLDALRPFMKALGVDPDKVKVLEQKLTEFEAAQKRQREESAMSAVASKYSGEKGEPKFDANAAKAAVSEVLNSPEAFWEAVHLYKNKDQIVNWAARQAAKRPPTATKTKPTERKTSSKLAQALESGDPEVLLEHALFGDDE